MAGKVGADDMSLWVLYPRHARLDTLSLRPCARTALFKTGGWGFVPSARVEFCFLGIVVAFTGLHWAVFALMGSLASQLFGLAKSTPQSSALVCCCFFVPLVKALSGGHHDVRRARAACARGLSPRRQFSRRHSYGGYLWHRQPFHGDLSIATESTQEHQHHSREPSS